MNRIRITGLYLLIALIILAELSISEMKRGSGRVDFSFIILLPFAIGLLCNRKWAVTGTATLGMISTIVVILVALMRTVSGAGDLSVNLGPFVFAKLDVVTVWLFALVYVSFFGIPMICVSLKRQATQATT